MKNNLFDLTNPYDMQVVDLKALVDVFNHHEVIVARPTNAKAAGVFTCREVSWAPSIYQQPIRELQDELCKILDNKHYRIVLSTNYGTTKRPEKTDNDTWIGMVHESRERKANKLAMEIQDILKNHSDALQRRKLEEMQRWRYDAVHSKELTASLAEITRLDALLSTERERARTLECELLAKFVPTSDSAKDIPNEVIEKYLDWLKSPQAFARHGFLL